jgi:hypothetical protein
VIVYVQPTGETFTSDEQILAQKAVTDAAQFWMTHSPIQTDIHIVATQFITTTDTVFDIPDMLLFTATLTIPTGIAPIFIIDANDTGRVLQQCCVGLAESDTIFVLTTTSTAVYAHEFGHSLYNLPHQYQSGLDIMSLDPIPAYQRGMIGCDSLALLGRECYTTFIPSITNGDN